MSRLKSLLISTLLVGGIVLSAGWIISTNNEIELKQLDLKVKQTEINQLEKQIDELNLDSESDSKRLDKLKQENQRLQTELVSKRAREAQEAKNAVYAAEQPKQTTYAYSGTCHDAMAQAGITDIANAYTLIMRESGCNENAVNPSSGACGIGQQLPCGKWAHAWNDKVGGMIDMQGYVMGRYGSWAAALAWSYANNWY